MTKCRNCEYCKEIGGTLEHGQFYCEHPNQAKIYKYFEEKKMVKSPGFLAFGEKYERKPKIKTSPAWCPLKERGGKR